MVYGTQITIVNGVYKPTYNWGAHLVIIGIGFECETLVGF